MPNEKNEEWISLKLIMVEWINNHQEQAIDDSLAFWLDPSGSLLTKYKVAAYMIYLNSENGNYA